MTLTKIESDIFSEEYEGINGNIKVIAILDTNCVRYMVFKRAHYCADWKRTSCREFDNNKKDLCLANATKALNK